jgi:Zn-dependent protease with chaperone function
MPAKFQHPPARDYSADSSTLGGRIKAILIGVLSVVVGWGFVGALLFVWAANLASCFGVGDHGAVQRNASGQEVVPRRPDTSNVNDVVAVRPLVEDWVKLGRPMDSLNVWVLDDDHINAASLGNGSFIVFSGLHRLQRPALDAIYAHEISHDELRHGQKGAEVKDVTDWIGNALGTFSGSGDETTATLQKWSGKLVLPTYSRKQELEADHNGVLVLQRLGYDSAQTVMCHTLDSLRQEIGESGGGFLSDHPGLSERVKALRVGDAHSGSDNCTS